MSWILENDEWELTTLDLVFISKNLEAVVNNITENNKCSGLIVAYYKDQEYSYGIWPTGATVVTILIMVSYRHVITP